MMGSGGSGGGLARSPTKGHRDKLAVLISLVVVRQSERFLAVEERNGWYLPAGGVDFGETFATGAQRETREEAGLEVVLDGVLRIEYRFLGPANRIRVVFAAHAADPHAAPKSVPDDDTLSARWLLCAEMASRNLRSPEALRLFEFVRAGARIHDMRLVRGHNGPVIMHERRGAPTIITVAIVVRCTTTATTAAATAAAAAAATANGAHGLVVVRKDTGTLPAQDATTGRCLQEVAAELCSTVGCVTGVTGFLGLVHVPPQTADATATITFVFAGELTGSSLLKPGFSLCAAEQLRNEPAADIVAIANEFACGKLEPVTTNVVAWEGSPFMP